MFMYPCSPEIDNNQFKYWWLLVFKGKKGALYLGAGGRGGKKKRGIKETLHYTPNFDLIYNTANHTEVELACVCSACFFFC